MLLLIHLHAAGLAHNCAAVDTLRGICLGRKSWLFAGSDRGSKRAAVMYTLIGTAKLNDVDPQAWLADVLDRIADLLQTWLPELLPPALQGAERQHALAAWLAIFTKWLVLKRKTASHSAGGRSGPTSLARRKARYQSRLPTLPASSNGRLKRLQVPTSQV